MVALLLNVSPEWDAVMWAFQQLQWDTLWEVFCFSQPKLWLWAPTKPCFALSSCCTVCVAACRSPSVPLLSQITVFRETKLPSRTYVWNNICFTTICAFWPLPALSSLTLPKLPPCYSLGSKWPCWGQARKLDVNIEFGVKSEFDTAHLWLELGQ